MTVMAVSSVLLGIAAVFVFVYQVVKVSREDMKAGKRTTLQFSAFVVLVAGCAATYLKYVQDRDKAAVEVVAQETERRHREEVKELQLEITQLLTGGGSIAYLTFSNGEGNTPVALYSVYGKYPVPEVNTIVFSHDFIEYLRKNGTVDIAKAGTRYQPIGPMYPRLASRIDFPNPEAGISRYVVVLYCGPVQLLELVTFSRDKDGTLHSAWRVLKVVGASADGMHEVSDIAGCDECFMSCEDFPRDTNGKVPWIDYPEQWDFARMASGSPLQLSKRRGSEKTDAASEQSLAPRAP